MRGWGVKYRHILGHRWAARVYFVYGIAGSISGNMARTGIGGLEVWIYLVPSLQLRGTTKTFPSRTVVVVEVA